MKRLLTIAMLAAVLTACKDSYQEGARQLLRQAEEQVAARQYDRALITIDSLRKQYPKAVEARREALALYQTAELERSQAELAVVDSALEAAKRQYASLQATVEEARQSHDGLEEALRSMNQMQLHRDSLQVRFDVLCEKIKYIHKKQKELPEGDK